jgi:hypothetical protein
LPQDINCADPLPTWYVHVLEPRDDLTPLTTSSTKAALEFSMILDT